VSVRVERIVQRALTLPQAGHGARSWRLAPAKECVATFSGEDGLVSAFLRLMAGDDHGLVAELDVAVLQPASVGVPQPTGVVPFREVGSIVSAATLFPRRGAADDDLRDVQQAPGKDVGVEEVGWTRCRGSSSRGRYRTPRRLRRCWAC